MGVTLAQLKRIQNLHSRRQMAAIMHRMHPTRFPLGVNANGNTIGSIADLSNKPLPRPRHIVGTMEGEWN